MALKTTKYYEEFLRYAKMSKWQHENCNLGEPPPKKKHGLLDILEDVADAATAVASVATSVAPVVAVAKTVAKATKPKKKGK